MSREGTMVGRLLCLVGRHAWAKHRNPKVGGPSGVYYACRRCGKDRLDLAPTHDDPGSIRFTRR
jgi:hypothetical protein